MTWQREKGAQGQGVAPSPCPARRRRLALTGMSCCTGRVEVGIAGRCKQAAERGGCASATGWFASNCVVACGTCLLCANHSQHPAYAKLYSNRLPVLRSRPPPPTLLEALIGADEDDRPTRAQPNCGSTPPPSTELTHATDIFAAINGTKPSVFGRAAHALLDAAMLAPDAPRVLCVSHSFRQRDEYKPTAHTVPSPHAIIQSPTAN